MNFGQDSVKVAKYSVSLTLTSSQVGRGSQVGEVVQADDIDDGTDNTGMVLDGGNRIGLRLRRLID